MENRTWAEFDTSAVQPARRIGVWNEYGSTALCKMSVEPRERDRFNAKLSRIDFGSLSLVNVKSTAARARGGGANWDSPLDDSFLISLPEQGRCIYEQDRAVCPLRPGDLFIRDVTKPWVQTCNDEMELLIIKVPFSELSSRIDDPMRLGGKALSMSCPHAAMAADIIRAAYRTLKSEPAGDWQTTLADVILSGIRVLYEGSSYLEAVVAETQKSANIRREAMTFIVRHLEDPDLTIAQVAEAIGVSNRRLQRAFVEVGETPSQFLVAQRLDRAAHELLRIKGASRASILDIALSVGFNDASHFSWSFTRRFGVSPRKYRDAKVH